MHSPACGIRAGTVGILTCAVVLMLGVPPAAAEPLTYANVVAAFRSPGSDPSSTTFVDLFTNPGVLLITESNDISVFVSVLGPPGVSDTLRLTWNVPGVAPMVQEVSVPNLGIPPPFTTLPRFRDYPVFYQPVPTTLTVDLLQSAPDFILPSGPDAGQSVHSFTYSFSVVQPIPEPGTLLLLGSALGAGVLGMKRRKSTD